MKKNTILLLAIIAFVFAGCNKNRVFEEHKGDFARYRWQKENVVSFTAPISEIGSKHHIIAAFRYIYGFQFKEINIKVKMTSPAGKVSEKTDKMVIVKPDGEVMSECAGDFCDLEKIFFENVTFEEKGSYTFEVSYDMPMVEMPNVIEVGIIIDKVE